MEKLENKVKQELIPTEKIRGREKSLERSTKEIRGIIEANFGQYNETTKFLKLEFGRKETDLDKANYEFSKFVKRMNQWVFLRRKGTLQYTKIIDTDVERNIIFHVIVYNMPFVRRNTLLRLWKNGQVMVTSLENKNKVTKYLTENLGKIVLGNETILDARFVGKGVYSSSRGIIRPENELEVKTTKHHEQLDLFGNSNYIA